MIQGLVYFCLFIHLLQSTLAERWHTSWVQNSFQQHLGLLPSNPTKRGESLWSLSQPKAWSSLWFVLLREHGLSQANHYAQRDGELWLAKPGHVFHISHPCRPVSPQREQKEWMLGGVHCSLHSLPLLCAQYLCLQFCEGTDHPSNVLYSSICTSPENSLGPETVPSSYIGPKLVVRMVGA